jgi:hypothetical protein
MRRDASRARERLLHPDIFHGNTPLGSRPVPLSREEQEAIAAAIYEPHRRRNALNTAISSLPG